MGEMEALMQECLGCRRCSIGGRTIEGSCMSNVFSNMNCAAKFAVVGQNPGKDEVERGEPFVGVSGKLFDESMAFVGLSRSDFYVCNVVRCYTPLNRKPYLEEMENCRFFLDKEFEILKPKMVISLGSCAFKQLTGMSGIMKHHGEIIFSPRYKVNVFPLLNPSPLNMNDAQKKEMFLTALGRFKEMCRGV